MSSRQGRTRIAIVGAGIAGLTLAIAINQFDKEDRYAIDMYETTPKLSEIGAGIMMYPKTLRIMKDIGVLETLLPCSDHLPDEKPRAIFEVRKADHKPEGIKIIDVVQPGGSLPLHRADLQRCLISHLPKPNSPTPCILHLSWRLINYRQRSPTESITLYFANGAITNCDVLIGADGIKSTVRQLFLSRLPNPEKYARCMEPLWAGTYAYRGLVSMEDLAKIYPGHRLLNLTSSLYISKDKYSVAYPVSGGQGVNLVATVFHKTKENTVREGPWQTEVTTEEFAEAFSGWEDEFQALIKCTKAPTRWALHNLEHLDVFAGNRVFLIGDSAHAMVPHMGAGAGSGIDDAYILAALLTHSSVPVLPSAKDVSNIINVYNTIRVPRGVGMLKASINQGHLFYFEGKDFNDYHEGDQVSWDLLYKTGLDIQNNWSWTAEDPRVERHKAEALLEKTLIQPRAML